MPGWREQFCVHPSIPPAIQLCQPRHNCHSHTATVILPFIITMTTALKINNQHGSDHRDRKFAFSEWKFTVLSQKAHSTPWYQLI